MFHNKILMVTNNLADPDLILSVADLLNSLLPDEEPHNNIYLSLDNLIRNLDDKSWPLIYSFWEVNLIKELGFGFTTDQKSSSKDILSINIDNVSYKVPKFIINGEMPENFSKEIVNQALSFTRNLMLNKFFLPNNLYLPKSRVFFENCFS